MTKKMEPEHNMSSDETASPVLLRSVASLKKAGQDRLSILIRGAPATGKTTQAIRAARGKTLVLLWSGIDTYYSTPEAEDFVILGPFPNWASFEAAVLTPLRLGQGIEGGPYDTVIIDGLEVALSALLQAFGGDTQQQKDWGIVAKRLGNMVGAVRDYARNVICTVALTEKTMAGEGTGEFKVALNPDSYRRVASHCSGQWYTFIQPGEQDADGNVLSLCYGVEKNPTLATHLRVSARAEYDVVSFVPEE